MAHNKNGYFKQEYEPNEFEQNIGNPKKTTYLLEHLATFTVNKETGIIQPSDGMRRLLQLEKTTGIWSQKMQLCLDSNWISIMDFESKNVIEKFPASFVKVPTAFTSNSPMEIYNNILVFIVDDGSGSRPEMHIFQSQSAPATYLAEDLKQISSGKVSHMREMSRPPVHHHREVISNVVSNESDSDVGNLHDEISSTSSDKYERDVAVLNHCFDDIEKFIARLQHATIASRELEKRNSKKSKKKDPGEGLLHLRTKAPYEKEFIDIFAKFKLSINLLAKLKYHIQDPSAFELIHFLFTPLVLIVEASNDAYYEAHLPSHVVVPLLTQDAIHLMNTCLTNKEKDVWRSLGDAWLIPKDQWKGYVNNYHPVFFDGWSPDYPVVDDLEESITLNSNSRRKNVIESHLLARHGGNNISETANRQYMQMKKEYDERYKSSQNYHYDSKSYDEGPINFKDGHRNISSRSDASIDSTEGNEIFFDDENVVDSGTRVQSLINSINNLHANDQTDSRTNADQYNIDQWLAKLQSCGAKVVQVTNPRTANNEKELTVAKGEILEILDDNRKWWKARNIRGQIAYVPHTIVTSYNFEKENDMSNNAAFIIAANTNKPIQPRIPQQKSSTESIRKKHIGKKGEFRYF